ncbi:MAG: membrane integrity-associated transporter subunit PqiC [Methylococcales bacterium]|nr:membrane integrity-associated transporter subunit PqiC [Methylococcales bacterium]
MLCAGLLLTACAETPAPSFYLLESHNLPVIATTTVEKKQRIGLGPLTLPAVLDRQQIVTRTENHGIQLAEFHQWAAPLKGNVIDVLSKNLEAQQANSIVRGYPWSAYGDMDYRIIIDISRFDSQLGKSANLEANWAIMEEKKHTIVSNGRTNLTQVLNDMSYQSAVLAQEKLLNLFSQQLSLELHRLPKN